jgi:endonuclease/exonuclease/phosphatase (EEP) superfamily protein YafD
VEPTQQPRGARFASLARLAALLAVPCALAPLLATAGGAHWALDLLSHFPHQCLVLLLLALCVQVPARRWWTAALLLPSIALTVARLWPLWFGGGPDPATGAVPLRVLAVNLCYENATPDAVLPQVEAFAPDLLAMTEFTPDARDRLQPLRAHYPHAVEVPRTGAFGIALWSRVPLRDAHTVPIGDFGFPTIVAIADTAAGPLGVVVAHPPPPRGAANTHARDSAIAALPALLATLPPRRLVLGDLNATRWSSPLRALLAATGLRDSCEGRGLQASWPSSLPRWLGIAIDHVLVSPDLAVTERRVGDAFGSDHLPVLATIAMPR